MFVGQGLQPVHEPELGDAFEGSLTIVGFAFRRAPRRPTAAFGKSLSQSIRSATSSHACRRHALITVLNPQHHFDGQV